MATSPSGCEMLHTQAIMAFKFKQEGTTNYCDMEPVFLRPHPKGPVALTYCGIIVFCEGLMFIYFLGHPYPRIYVPTNV